MQRCALVSSKRSLKASALLALALALVAAQVSMAQRGEDSGENEDFDDPGFDDNGYHQPQRDTDSSNHQPNQYAGADVDEDDEPDETLMSPQVAQEAAMRRQQPMPYTGQAQQFDAVQPKPHFYPAAPVGVGPVLLAGGPVDTTMNDQMGHMRFRRSASEGDIEDLARTTGQRSLVRRRRHAKSYLGPVYTYVKTDKHAHFKWGVKHKVGKHLG